MKIKADSKNKVTFNNQVDYCIGTGRMGLALTKEYYEELKLTQEEIGFSHIRGHGLFTDDMAIYHDFTFNGNATASGTNAGKYSMGLSESDFIIPM